MLGNVKIGEGVLVGANSTCYPKIKVGDWATLGMCSAVMTDVNPSATIIGNIGKKAFGK